MKLSAIVFLSETLSGLSSACRRISSQLSLAMFLLGILGYGVQVGKQFVEWFP
ncbi:hypothetical protein QUB63_32415 [Microcoleus sp. ARI1-B5]|uniref:hypothetical protein n=1 Tax=Microcoleus sp. ARI1-A4 TaxID=2818559 RepID=UPI002FD4D230